ncbi:MAG: tol-pal system-associated acyl-CoA thioesterase [Paracoccaceae bacterium]
MMHRLAIRVYYEDTDFGGVVYYANYLKFLERGRTEALRDLGVDQVALKQAGTVFVVRRVEADYVKPARFDDILEVRTRAETIRKASVVMAQEIFRGDDLLLTAIITVACMGENGRPVRIPPEISANLVQLEQSVPDGP